MMALAARQELHKVRGFTFVELSIVLIVSALLMGYLSTAYLSTFDSLSRREGIEHAKMVQASVRAFALRNGKLPCPAANLNGYEDLVSGECKSGTQVGYVPYISLGLALPKPAHFASYAVYRKSNADATLDQDLAAAKERTGDAAGSADFANANDLIYALLQIDTSAVNAAYPFVTGDDAASGANDCAANKVAQVAFWVTVPLTDANNSGNRFDSGNLATNLCATSPQTSSSAVFDDVVLVDSPLELAGWLKAWIRP